ncbi:MAG: hypothetical protein KDC27_17475, partial [Acidobacteria bacterium]|nr:hypothetical protein [Acidobacteriota bacterium]
MRLRVPDELTRPVWVTTGSNGPTNLIFYAYNAGDGTLSVEADGGFSSDWLGAQVGGAATCDFDSTKSCTPVQLVLNTAALPAGTVTGSVEVRAPGALDAPQSVAVTVHVGSNVPDSISFYVPPREGAGDSLDFQTPRGPAPFLTAGASFLRVSSSNLGSFRNLHEHRVQAFYQAGLANGANNGTIYIEGSSFAADNRAVPVTLNVTSQPISQLSGSSVTIPAAQGHTPGPQYIVASNRGEGSLSLSAAEVATDSGGDWLSVQDLGGNILGVNANIDGLEPGRYRGTVRVNSNAANSPQQVEVFLDLSAEKPPQAAFSGLINNATTDTDNPRRFIVSPGTIAALFGSQLSFSFESATTLPLPTELGGAKATWSNLDGSSPIDSPLYFVSSGQINLQVPWELTPGTKKLQLTRDGQVGNAITVQVDSRSATLTAIGIGRYGAIVNATRSVGGTVSLPFPAGTGLPAGYVAEPARPLDILTVFATGLGPVSPTVVSGQAPPSGAPAALDIPIVN